MKKNLFITLLLIVAVIAMSTTSVRNAKLTSKLTVFENLVTPATTTFIQLNGADEALNYKNSTTAGNRFDADLVYADTVINSGTLDLTTLANTLGETLDLTSHVIVAIKFIVQDDSAAIFTLDEAAANSYPLFGATYDIDLQANQSLLFKADTVLIPVSGSAKNIDYTSNNDSTYLFIILIAANLYI